MKKIGVVGSHALRISHTLTNQGLACAVTSARDIVDTLKCPDVLLVSTSTAQDATIEVLALRNRNFCGRIIALLRDVPETDEAVNLYLSGADNYLAGDDQETFLYAVVKSASSERSQQEQTLFTAGNVSIDTRSMVVKVDDKVVDLEPTGYHLLVLLFKNPGATIPRERFHNEIWPDKSVITTIVDVYVSRIRKALNQANARGFVLTTVRGTGYRLDIE